MTDLDGQEREALIERLKAAASGSSFVSRKYGEGIRQQIRYLEGLSAVDGEG